MLGPPGKAMLESMDDQNFCIALVNAIPAHATRESPLGILWEPWILQRLQLIRQRAAYLYFGLLLGPLRQGFPGAIFPSELAEAMLDASAVGIDGLEGDVSSSAFADAAYEVFAHGLTRGTDPGWPSVADHYTVRLGELTIITGVASHMKSTWLQNLCVNLALNDWVFGVYSPEHYPIGLLSTLLLQQYTGLSIHSAALHEPGEFVRGMAWVTGHFHAIQPPEETQVTLPWLLAVARAQIEKYGITGLVLDPWNTIDHLYVGQSETQYISGALEKVRRFARAHNVHVWLVAHPTKLHRAVSGDYAGKYPPPTPYDIAGSAHWHNKADNCLSIWRDVEQNEQQGDVSIEVHIQKVRNRAAGKPGMVRLRYDGLRFTERSTPAMYVTNGARYGHDE